MKNKMIPDISFFFPSFGDGGVERCMVYLAKEIGENGYHVDFLVDDKSGPFLSMLPPQVRIVETGSRNKKKLIDYLCGYLHERKPKNIISVKGYGEEVFRALRNVKVNVRHYILVNTTFTSRGRWRNPLQKYKHFHAIRSYFPKAHQVFAVSKGIADDVSCIAEIPLSDIQVMPNPVVNDDLFLKADEPVDHPWFLKKDIPVIMAAGRLSRAKDYPTLIRAFARALRKKPLRLVILGDGRKKSKIEFLANKLGVRQHLWLAGFVENPYAFMAKSDLYVLSSLWEGFGNVLVEALALGIPLVSTDCHSGPREILQDGKYGRLVPVGDVNALAGAMLETISSSFDAGFMKKAVIPYSVKNSAAAYIAALRFT